MFIGNCSSAHNNYCALRSTVLKGLSTCIALSSAAAIKAFSAGGGVVKINCSSLNPLNLIALLVLCINASGVSAASTQTICNGTPYQVSIAIGWEEGGGVRSKGWYNQDPGDCTDWFIAASNYYYFARTNNDDVMKWIHDSDEFVWEGKHPLCVSFPSAFDLTTVNLCENSREFRATSAVVDAVLTLRDDYFGDLQLIDAKEVRSVLLSRKEFEEYLKNTSGREPPFLIGAGISTTVNPVSGVRIESVTKGMPAEEEGIEVGDIIVSMNGRAVSTINDLWGILDNIDALRTSPVPIEILRNEEYISGSIVPMFFPFNHREYSESGRDLAGFRAVGDGAALGFGNELGCGAYRGLYEGLDALLESRSFDFAKFIEKTKTCTERENNEFALQKLLYADAVNAGYWVSILVPGIPIAKMF